MKHDYYIQDHIKALDEDRKVALARIASDLIKADRVIDDEEINFFTDIFGEDMSRQFFLNAQSYTFAEAMKLLAQPIDPKTNTLFEKKRNADIRNRRAKTAIEVLTKIAKGDGICDPTEAILLTAIHYFLIENKDAKYDVQSYMLQDFFIAKRFVIYIGTNTSLADLNIENNYNTICQLFASIGLQFVYVPKLAKLYASKDLKTFKNMTMYFFPTITEGIVEKIYDNISNMTTKLFVEDYLCEKMHMNLHDYQSPSFLVMLGNSDVVIEDAYGDLKVRRFADFLKITIDNNDALSAASQFVKDFNKRVSYTQHISFNPSNEKLLYQGAYKLFFNLIALPDAIPLQGTLNISPKKHKIFINDTCLGLPLTRLALYALILHSSTIGEKGGIPISPTAEEAVWINNLYKNIYSYLKNDEVDIKSPIKRMSVTISEINGQLENHFKGLCGILKIVIKRKKYSVLIKPEDIMVDRTPMLNHSVWMSLSDI